MSALPVHISIHDVSPIWAAEVERALALCARIGARPALLVVPDYHGRAPLQGDEGFCRRLRTLQSEGHEIYLHGWSHRAPTAPARSTARGRVERFLSQRVWSDGEAELAQLGEPEGRARIADGERVLRDAGLRLDGFVAPAWVMPRWLLGVLSERGIDYTEGRLRVYDPVLRRSRASVVLNWATRSRARALASAAWCRAARSVRTAKPTRIAVHPADVRVPMIEREVERALEWAHGDLLSRGSDLLR